MQKIDRTGERRMMNCGMWAEIIEYNNWHDITVKFDDGTVIAHRAYGSFARGEVFNPNLKRVARRIRLSHIGERRMMRCGMEAEIIEYENYHDITVRFDNGIVVAHKTYRVFLNGGIQPFTFQEKYLGMVKMMNCGMEAKIVAYRGSGDIDVMFTDGTVITNRNVDEFKSGRIHNPNCYTCITSIGETALLYYLASYGYEKAPKGSLKEYGLGRFEIDVLNKETGIGIEYDGMYHQNHLQRDLRKNNLFLKAFKQLIRVRDYRLPHDDPRVVFYDIDSCNGLSKDYEATLKLIFNNLGFNIDVNLQRDKNAIYDLLYKNSPRIRIGEKRMTRVGLIAEIVGYRNATDIDVRFSDGIVVTTSYQNFLNGKVSHPTLHPQIVAGRNKRLHQIKMMNCGMEAEIIEYFNAHNITVRFKDGTIIRERSYSQFKCGVIQNPNLPSIIDDKGRVGERRRMNCGMYAEIIEYNGVNDITVKFEDGAIVKHKHYGTFQRGEIANPNFSSRTAMHRASRLGERRLMNCGRYAEIIEYNGPCDITLRFDDGTIVEHKSYDAFKRGAIGHPNINKGFYRRPMQAAVTA